MVEMMKEMAESVDVQTKDLRLLELLQGIQGNLAEIKEIMEYGRETGLRYDLALNDLNHILEIEPLNLQQRVTLQNYEKQFIHKRRVVKNINAVEGMLGEKVEEWEQDIAKRMAKVKCVVVPDNKHYRLRSKDVVEVFQEITGRSVVETDGRYKDISDNVGVDGKVVSEPKKRKRKRKKSVNSSEQLVGVPITESTDVKPLNGKKFEKELAKAVGRKPYPTKRKRNKNWG